MYCVTVASSTKGRHTIHCSLTLSVLTFIEVQMYSNGNKMRVYLNMMSYLENHCSKQRLVCTHFDAFSILILNLLILFQHIYFKK